MGLDKILLPRFLPPDPLFQGFLFLPLMLLSAALFAADRMPPAQQLINQMSQANHELNYEGSPIGSMSINEEGSALVLDEICSGNYLSDCFLPTLNNQFSDVPVIY